MGDPLSGRSRNGQSGWTAHGDPPIQADVWFDVQRIAGRFTGDVLQGGPERKAAEGRMMLVENGKA